MEIPEESCGTFLIGVAEVGQAAEEQTTQQQEVKDERITFGCVRCLPCVVNLGKVDSWAAAKTVSCLWIPTACWGVCGMVDTDMGHDGGVTDSEDGTGDGGDRGDVGLCLSRYELIRDTYVTHRV